MKLRILFAGAAAVAAMAFGASSASAVTVSPAPSGFAATSSSALFEIGSIPISTECKSSVLRGSVTSTGTMQGLTPLFSNCTTAFFGGATVTAKEPVTYEFAFDANGLNSTVGKVNLTFTSDGCNYRVTGYLPTTNLGASPLRLAEWIFPNPSGSTPTLTVASVTQDAGHCFNFITAGMPVKFKSTYKFSPSPLTVTK